MCNIDQFYGKRMNIKEKNFIGFSQTNTSTQVNNYVMLRTT